MCFIEHFECNTNNSIKIVFLKMHHIQTYFASNKKLGINCRNYL